MVLNMQDWVVMAVEVVLVEVHKLVMVVVEVHKLRLVVGVEKLVVHIPEAEVCTQLEVE
jgi:hypothetical protein